MIAKGKRAWGRDKLGVWDQQIQTTLYRMENNCDLLYSTRNYIQYPIIHHNGKEYEKIYITKSLFCTPTNTSFLISQP